MNRFFLKNIRFLTLEEGDSGITTRLSPDYLSIDEQRDQILICGWLNGRDESIFHIWIDNVDFGSCHFNVDGRGFPFKGDDKFIPLTYENRKVTLYFGKGKTMLLEKEEDNEPIIIIEK